MLWPEPSTDVDPEDLILADRRPPQPRRPWVVLNMIATVDGAATDDDERSGGLGGPADRRIFRAVRAAADVIVAGATTVIAEGYGPPRLPPRLRAARQARGRPATPRIAVVTGSLTIDPDSRLFADSDVRPIVLTGHAPEPARRSQLATVADVVDAGRPGTEGVDWRRALRALRELGHEVALVEGGPLTNGQLVAADTVDEVLLSLSPVLAAGEAPRIAHGPTVAPMRRLRLDRVLEADGFLFLRYVRDREKAV